MTFDTQESSRQDGEPVTLFLIRYGSAVSNYYAVTNHSEPVLYAGITYQPFTSSHSNIKRLLTLDDARMTITLPSDHPMATRWRRYPPTEVTSVVIRQGHVGNAEFKVVWLGRVLGHSDNQDGNAEFSCEPRITSLARPGLNRNYQYGCPHLLYSQGPGLCNADRDAATTAFTVVEVQSGLVKLDPSWNALADGRLDYIKGMLEWTTADNRYENRLIVGVSAADGTINLSGPATGLLSGMTVNAVLGCNHKAYAPQGDCERLHSNINNYGGQPLIPLDNPFGLKNGYY